jgi:hypothetical protein
MSINYSRLIINCNICYIAQPPQPDLLPRFSGLLPQPLAAAASSAAPGRRSFKRSPWPPQLQAQPLAAAASSAAPGRRSFKRSPWPPQQPGRTFVRVPVGWQRAPGGGTSPPLPPKNIKRPHFKISLKNKKDYIFTM